MSDELVLSINKLTGQNTQLLNEVIDLKRTTDGNAKKAVDGAATATTKAASAEASALSAAQDRTAAEIAAQNATVYSEMSTVHQAVGQALEEGHLFAAKAVDMEAMRAENLRRFAAGGFVHMGKHYAVGEAKAINQGMWSYPGDNWQNILTLGRASASSGFGDSRTDNPYIHMGGFVSKLGGIGRAAELSEVQVKSPEAEAGTRVYDSATGESIDYRYDVDPKYGDVAGTHNEAVARAWEGLAKNGDFRFGDDGSWQISGGVTIDNTGAQFTASGTDSRLRLNDIGIMGKDIVIEFDCDVAETIAIYIYGESNKDEVIYVQAAPGRNKVVSLVAERNESNNSSDDVMFRSGSGAFSGKISNVSIRPLTQEVVTNPVDLAGLEGWLERITVDNPFVYPDGLPQNQATTMDGIATTTSARPDSYYAVYEGDTSSRGKGVNFFTASMAEQDAMMANPWNHIYNLGLDNEGKPIIVQWRIRQRTIRGAGNGDWNALSTTAVALSSGTNATVSPKGQQEDAAEFTKTSPYFYGSGAEQQRNLAPGQLGAFLAAGWGGGYGSPANIAGYNGLCFFLPICTVSRLNQGAYHPSLNPAGTRMWNSTASGDHKKWHENLAPKNITTKDAFHDATSDYTTGGKGYRIDSGYIGRPSARPDGRSYDAIYASGLGGVNDLRLSAWGVTGEDYSRVKQELIAGAYRGAEKLQFTQVSTQSRSEVAQQVTLADIDKNIAVSGGDTLFIQDYAGTYNKVMVASVSPDAESPDNKKITYTPEISGRKANVPIVIQRSLNLTVSGEFQITEVIGDPVDILQCDALKEGWVGIWNPNIPNGIDYVVLTRKCLDDRVSTVLTDNHGTAWTPTASTNINNDTNTHTLANPEGRIRLYEYTAFAQQVEESTNSPVQDGEAGVGSVTALSDYRAVRGSVLGEGLIGKVLKSSATKGYGTHTLLDYGMEPGAKILVTHSAYQPTHSALSLSAPTNDSPGVKFLDTRTKSSNQAFLDLHFMELAHNGTDWGDSGQLVIANGTSTYTNDNGETLLCGTKRLVKPIGWIHNTQ